MWITEQQARGGRTELHDLLGYFDTQTKEQATLIEAASTDLLQQLGGDVWLT